MGDLCIVFTTDHSSAGRAEDCRVAWLSLGRWFDSGWSEFLSFKSFNLFLKKQKNRVLNFYIIVCILSSAG